MSILRATICFTLFLILNNCYDKNVNEMYIVIQQYPHYHTLVLTFYENISIITRNRIWFGMLNLSSSLVLWVTNLKSCSCHFISSVFLIKGDPSPFMSLGTFFIPCALLQPAFDISFGLSDSYLNLLFILDDHWLNVIVLLLHALINYCPIFEQEPDNNCLPW